MMGRNPEGIGPVEEGHDPRGLGEEAGLECGLPVDAQEFLYIDYFEGVCSADCLNLFEEDVAQGHVDDVPEDQERTLLDEPVFEERAEGEYGTRRGHW